MIETVKPNDPRIALCSELIKAAANIAALEDIDPIEMDAVFISLAWTLANHAASMPADAVGNLVFLMARMYRDTKWFSRMETNSQEEVLKLFKSLKQKGGNASC